MQKKIILSFVAFLLAVIVQAQSLNGFSFLVGYQPINFAIGTQNYIGGRGFQRGSGFSVGLGYTKVNHDKKLHPGVTFSMAWRRHNIMAEDRRTNFKISNLDANVQVEFGGKVVGAHIGFSMLVPAKIIGEIYSPDSSALAPPYQFGNSGKEDVPWFYLSGNAGLHLHLYSKDDFRLTLFGNAGCSFARVGPLFVAKADQSPYKAPMPGYIEAGIAVTLFNN